MKKFYYLTLISSLLFIYSANAQTAGDYRSAATGNWNAIATWETFDGISWVAAAVTPSSADGAITIRSPHTVTISAVGLSYDQVVVDAGGQVSVAPTITHTLANGTGTDLVINGTWLNQGGTWTVTGASWSLGAGGTFIHNTTSGISTPLSLAMLDPLSNFIYRGSSTLSPAVSYSGRTFGNLFFESSSGNWAPSAFSGTTASSCTNYTIGANVSITLTYTGVFTINGDYTNNGTVSYSTGTQTNTFTGAGKTIGGSSTCFFETLNFTASASITTTNSVTLIASFTGTVDGTLALGAGFTNSGTLNVNGTLQLNSGGFVAFAPVYGANSLLKYNSGGTYGRSAEWNNVGTGTIGTTPGYPNDVQVSNNTTLNLPNGSNSDRSCNRDLTIDAGSNLYADFSGGSVLLTVGRNFSMAGNVSLGNAIGGDLRVRGNFTRTSGTFNPNGRAVFFDGPSGDQTISGVTTFDFLVLDKAAGNLLLASSISLNQTLTLTTGKVVLGANDLILLNAALSSLNASSSSSYIVTDGAGVFRRAVGTIFSGSDYFFPVGNIANRQIATINFGGSLTANNTLAARFITGSPGNNGLPLTESGDNLDRTSVIGFWEINSGSATADPYTGSFNAVGFGDIIDYTKLHLLKRVNAGSNWVFNGVHVATSGSNANAVLQRTAMSGFSQFGVGGEQSVSLPVSLLSFSGYRDGSRNQLRWTTSSEQNNSGFEVQRSTDGINYTALGFVNSQALGGNSTDQLNYAYTDNSPSGSKQYYRLRQVNFDGNSKLSNVVLIKGEKPVSLTIDGLFPNPASTLVNVLIATPAKDKVTLVVTDIAGRTMLQKVVGVETGSNTIPVDISRLTNGTYMVKLVCESNCEGVVSKFIKQ